MATLTPPPTGWEKPFAAAIRSKPNWHLKLLDDSRGLAEKWVAEARLVERGVGMGDIDALFLELKREALRIQHLDPIFPPSIPHPADLTLWPPIDTLISTSLSQHTLRTAALKERVGIFTSDNLVPRELRDVLERELDRLGEGEVGDWHPGSGGKVLDLIHPSLYPYVQGTTRLLNHQHPLNRVEKFRTETKYHVDEYTERSTAHESVYAWLPSIFAISLEGSVSIESPITALGPRAEHPTLYAALERVFQLALPQIERSMFWTWVYEKSASFRRWEERAAERQAGDLGRWRERVVQQQREKREEEEGRVRDGPETEVGEEKLGAAGESRLRGKKLKVIVKAANYVLKPGEEYKGSWHVEGAPHEHIRASLIYYYSCSPTISDSGLSFRRLRTEQDRPNMAVEHGDDFSVWGGPLGEEEENYEEVMDYPSDVEDAEASGYPYQLPRNIVLGTVPTTGVGEAGNGREGTGRMLSFPNWLQHQVAGLKNTATEGTEPAVRKILCFFIVNESYPAVDPETHQLNFPGFSYSGPQIWPTITPVPTTADILPQQRFRIFPYVHNALDMACKRATGGRGLPVELAIDICAEAGMGMSRADAEEHRRRLMDDRRADVAEVNDAWEEHYGLCEH
ncbi:hypothetical protein CALCODRAFT_518889 [Calocera cornea HHB12733]|uniref:DUF4246 domain-containing protein n=1 Tax=Calocera cornea HHB12733 TaxID=1353952 RepID=A0A165EN67_9BASI|nr:hypothetical protein CALCODRAFT_518889 [Calocera cornea HHB12733]